MFPVQTKNMETYEYTHKKFSYGYFHKKLGRRLVRCIITQKETTRHETQHSKQTPQIHDFRKPNIFKPYDVTLKANKQPYQRQYPQDPLNPMTFLKEAEYFMAFYALQQSAQQSQEEYLDKLQRQRAALYIKHVMQFYENGGYGWASVHPNAIKNPAFYQGF